MKHKMEFHFYLDAWNWCQQNGIEFNHDMMHRKDFKTWVFTYTK